MDDTVTKARELIQGVQLDFLKKSAMWLRVRYLRNMVSQAITDGYTDADIDWDMVNSILMEKVNEYDYNMAKEVHSYRELDELHSIIVEATVLNLSWQKHKCKDCGNDFVLNFGEIEFYKNKELHIPKRCKCCRDKRKLNKA